MRKGGVAVMHRGVALLTCSYHVHNKAMDPVFEEGNFRHSQLLQNLNCKPDVRSGAWGGGGERRGKGEWNNHLE